MTDDDMVSKIQALQQLARQQMAKQGKAEICDPLIDIETKIKPLTWPEVLNAADQYVRSKPTFSKYIEGTLLENDVPVWIADFYMKRNP